jgi:DNA (cytosine-5)-methyltransferase 1
MMQSSKFQFYEFFAGGGMARLGLGSRWHCLFSNDFSEKKAQAYRTNFPPAHEFKLEDVFNLTTQDLPGQADLAWASFPCQDLSLAGKQRGLSGERSGSFWGFWKLMQGLQYENRAVPIIVLENVVGTITTRGGEDFRILLDTLVSVGYRIGPMVINAVHFVPQSRPRLFVIAVRNDHEIPRSLIDIGPTKMWHPEALQRTHQHIPQHIRDSWVWWRMPAPLVPQSSLTDLIEDAPDSVKWHTQDETDRLLELMTPRHQEKVAEAQRLNRRVVGTAYRRIRPSDNGVKAQRAEVRFDDVSGCLRTGSGGSSRQFIVVVEGDRIRSRLLSTREAARLMGVPENYRLPQSYNEAYHLMGDGLVVPVVSWLEQNLLSPVLGFEEQRWSNEYAIGPRSSVRSDQSSLQVALLERTRRTT